MTLLSIVTVCFNAEKTLQDTFDSLKKQKTDELEYIVIDGKSKDSSFEIVKNNPDIVDICISEKDSGLYEAMNKGFNLSSGKYIMFLNADDLLKENAINSILEEIKYSDSDIIYGVVELYNKATGKKRKYLDINYTKFKSYLFLTPPHPGFIMKSSLFDKVGGFNTKYSLASDFDIQMKSWKYARSYKRLKTPLVKMSLGGRSNSSVLNRLRGFSQLVLAYSKNVSPLFVSFIVVRYIYKIIYLIIRR